MPPNNASQVHDICITQSHSVSIMFLPSAWSSAVDDKREWFQVDFPPDPRNTIPKKSGVYAFVVEPNMFNLQPANGLFYVGKATNLYQRIASYISELNHDFNISKRPNIWRMLNQWNGHIKYYFTITTNVSEAEALEDEMLKAFIPHFNKQFDAETGAVQRAF